MNDVRFRLAKVDPPCKDCVPPTRYQGCHSSCQKYIEWRAERDGLLEQKQKNLTLNEAFLDIRYAYVNQAKKNKGRTK